MPRLPRWPRDLTRIASWEVEFRDPGRTPWSGPSRAHALCSAWSALGKRSCFLNHVRNDRFRIGFDDRERFWFGRLRHNLNHLVHLWFGVVVDARGETLSGTKDGVCIKTAQRAEASLVTGEGRKVVQIHWSAVP